MLVTKEVEKIWSSKNVNRYSSLGYRFTEYGNSFFVRVNHLGNYDRSNVEVLCDYCMDNGVITSVMKTYENYIKERKRVPKDTCVNCKQEKYKDLIIVKQNKGELKLGDKGYFNFKENRLKELKIYIDRNRVIDKMEDNPEGCKLYRAIISNKETPHELALELGYDLDEVMRRKPDGFYRNFKELEYSIKKIIKKLGRFPTSSELKAELNIDHRYINYHGGLHDIKRKMNYDDAHDLIDVTGFYNSSSYELEVANFLVERKIKYKREQYPFADENYRSDFTLYSLLPNGHYKDVHVEVWGYLKSNKSKIALDYNAIRKIKEKLYKNNNVQYISIEPTVFNKKKNKQIKNSLITIFANIIDSLKRCEEYTIVNKVRGLSNESLYKEVMQLSEDGKTFPTASQLRDEKRSVYVEIMKRFDTYVDFAEMFNGQTKFKSKGYWSKDRVYNIFDYMIEKYGKILSRVEAHKERMNDDVILDYSKICGQMEKTSIATGRIDLKLNYYLERIVDNEFEIPENDLSWIKRAVINVSRRGNVPYTLQQQEQAKQILEKYNARKLTS